jgi:EmrB/QacA subfamily drug resistance transporter
MLHPMGSLGLVLTGLSLASFLTAFSGSSITIALPAISADLGLGAVTTSWVPLSYILASAMFLLPLGRAADLYGRKRFFILGVAVYALSSLLAGLSWSGPVLLASRALQGVGGALMFSTSGAIIVASFPVERRGQAIGINSAAVYAGLSSGPVLGGLLIRVAGWHSVLGISAVLALPVLLLLNRFLPADEIDEAARFDGLGAGIYGPSVAALVLGLAGALNAAGAALAALGLSGLVVFGLVENRLRDPLVDLSLFRLNRVFTFSNVAAMIHYGATYSISFFMSLFLQTVKHMTPDQAGLVLLTQPLVQAIFSPLAGRLSDRVEPRIIASLGMAATVVGLAFLSRLGAGTPVVRVVAVLASVGLGYALFISPNTNAIMSSVGRRTYGLAASMVSTMRLFGQMLSMSTAAVLLAVYVGNGTIAASGGSSLNQAMRVAFAGAAGLCVAGILLSWARGQTRNEAEAADQQPPEARGDSPAS